MNISGLMNNISLAGYASQTKQQVTQDSIENNQTAQVDSFQKKSSGAADFVAKIKATNEAQGFIATALKGLDAIATSENPSETAATYNFNGKNILDAQTFDTTAGIIGISVYIGDLDSSDPSFKERIEQSKSELLNIKDSLAKPVSAMKVKQEENLKTQFGNNPFISKINNILDGIEESANRVGNQIF